MLSSMSERNLAKRYLPCQALSFSLSQQCFSSKTQCFVMIQGVHDLRSFHECLSA
jgi:hypothetical protein